MSMQNQSVVQDWIDSLIDVLNAQAFAEDQIEDTCEHAHTPAISAAIAAPTFRETASLLIVTHFSLSTPLITIPYPLLPLSLKLPSQKPRIAFHTVD